MASTQRYQELCRKKTDIEKTLKELHDVLESQKGVGMTGNLVDKEGFPRADIDVYTCRHARHQISCLQNDHISVMEDIEEELVAIHSAARAKASKSDVEMAEVVTKTREMMEVERVAFAEVDRVDAGSPAAVGGLEVGDKLVEFGSVSVDNFVSMKTVAAVLQHSVNKNVRVLVERGGMQIWLLVTPGKWSGPGLLGCNIKPLKK